MQPPLNELQALLDQQRNCFDAFRGDPPGARDEGDLEMFAVLTHVTLCQLLSKLIDAHSDNPLAINESTGARILQFDFVDTSAPTPSDPDDAA